VRHGRNYADVPYSSLQIHVAPQRFIEDGAVPPMPPGSVPPGATPTSRAARTGGSRTTGNYRSCSMVGSRWPTQTACW